MFTNSHTAARRLEQLLLITKCCMIWKPGLFKCFPAALLPLATLRLAQRGERTLRVCVSQFQPIPGEFTCRFDLQVGMSLAAPTCKSEWSRWRWNQSGVWPDFTAGNSVSSEPTQRKRDYLNSTMLVIQGWALTRDGWGWTVNHTGQWPSQLPGHQLC